VAIQLQARTNPTTASIAGPQAQTSTDYGAGVGRALDSVGAEVGNIGQVLQQRQDAATQVQAMRDLATFEQTSAATQMQLQHDAPVNIKNFPDQALQTFKNQEAAFLNGIGKTAPQLQGQFAERTAQLGTSVYTNSLGFQYKQQDEFFKGAAEDQYNQSKDILGANPTQEALAQEKARIASVLGSSALDAPTQASLTRTYSTGLEAIVYKGQVLQDYRNQAAAGPGGMVRSGTAELISAFDPAAKADPNGTAAKVAQLQQTVSASQVGPDVWARLPDRAQSALLSVADSNGGQLPDTVLSSIKSGNLQNVANAVQDIGTQRSATEASILRGDSNTLEARLDRDPAFANLPYEDRLTLRHDAETQATAEQVAAQKAQDEADANLRNSLQVNLMNGTAGQTDIDHLISTGVISKAADITAATSALKTYETTTQYERLAHAKLSTGALMDPSSETDKKALNAYVGAAGIAAINDKDGNYAANVIIPLVRRSGDIPTMVAGQLTSMIRSTDPSKANFALDMMSQLQQADQKAFSQRFSKDTESAVNLFTQGKSYYTSDELLSLVQGGKTPEDRANIANLRVEAQNILKGNAVPAIGLAKLPKGESQQYTNTFTNSLQGGGWFGGSAELPVDVNTKNALTSDFQALFVDEYPKYRNPDEAAAAATKLMERDWGISNITGSPSVMKYPPEKTGYAPLAGSYSWITDQIRSDLKLPADTNFQLVGDTQTQTEFGKYRVNPGDAPSSDYYLRQDADKPPSYLVVTKDASGVSRLQSDANGQPQRVYFQQTQAMKDADLKAYQLKHLVTMGAQDDQTYSMALEHSLDTGIPLPVDYVTQHAESIAKRTAAVQAAGVK
jgi:hypothetical protein